MQNLLRLDSEAVRMDYFTGNQRTLGASCSKPESLSIPNSTSSNARISSYTHLDKILDHMLAEVDEQERLVQLDCSQKSLQPVCVNSLKLVPSTDAVFEIPVSNFAKHPKVFETKHEIMLDGDTAEQCNNEVSDLDDEISLTTLNHSQDTDSLFSFESISETYFLESIANKYKASSESLNDLEPLLIHSQISDDEHVYEIVEPKDNCPTVINQEPYNNQQEIWWEGTYRDLSIVPEEDEDNISDISQCVNRNKYTIDQKYDLPKTLNIPKHLGDDNYDNISHHSSSDVSQTTGDEYDTSDIEHNVSSNRPVKAEIKLIVKTLDRGREDVEIRSVRDFADQTKNGSIDNQNSVYKYPSLSHTFPRQEKLSNSKSVTKPSYTLQRLFIRSPESAGFVNQVSKELSKSNPELVAMSNIQYPLQYDPNMSYPEYFKNIEKPRNIDLYANTPFYPCYGSYMKTENVKLSPDNLQNIPTAYCDWLLQPDDPNGGKTTSPSKQLVSNEVDEPKIVTGESIIHDVLSKDIKPVLDQTKMFIRMESQPETSNVCIKDDANTPGQKIKSPELPDKASKELDNKKEKNKGSRGFFSSLKSLVSRSLDSSDSESKEEKTPKKKKKEKGTPKKVKKAAKEEQILTNVEIIPQSPSLKPEKKTKALYESQELDNIPSIDEIESNGLQVTDLDADPIASDDIKIKATSIVDNVINDSQKAAYKMMEGKIQEFNLEGTVTPEEVRRSIEPIIINEDEFLVVIEPNNYHAKPDSDYEDIQSPERKSKEISKAAKEKIGEKSDDEGKSDSLKRKSVGFLKLFGKKDSKESDDESRTEDKQIISKSDTEKADQKTDEHRKSSGFFGLFSKKTKDDEPIIEEKSEVKNETQAPIKHSAEIIEFSQDVQQQMIDTAGFLLKEVELFEDVKLVNIQIPEEKKIEIKITDTELEQKPVCIIGISEEVQQQMVDTTHFLMREIELFDDVKPQKVIKEESDIDKEIKIKETAKPETQEIILSPEIQQGMVDTAHFLLSEVENFEDVRPIYKQDKQNQRTEITTEIAEPSESTTELLKEIEVFVPTEQLVDKTEKVITTEEKLKEKETTTEAKSPEKVPKQDSDQESKPGFFTKLGEKFGGKSIDKKDEPKDKKAKKKKDKKPGFFSKIGEKFSTLSDDEKDTTKDPNEKKVYKIENKINIETNVKDIQGEFSNIKTKLPDTKDIDVKEKVIDVKDITKDEIVTFFSNKENQIKDDVHDAEGKIIAATHKAGEKTKDVISDVSIIGRATIEKTETDVIDLSNKIQNDTQDNDISLKENITGQIKSTTSDINDTLRNSLDSTQAFINDTGDRVESKVHIIKETKDKTADIFKETTIHANDFEKFETSVPDFSDKVKESTADTKQSVIAVTDIVSQKVHDATSHVKDVTKDAADKTSTKLSDTGDKIKDTAKDTADNIIAEKDSTKDKIKETVSDAKDTTKDVVEKTGGFFSGLGKKFKGTAKDTKEEIIIKAKSGKEKVEEAAVDTKEGLKTSAEKTGVFFSDVGDKIKDKAHDTKDTVVEAKDKAADKIKETATGAKDFTKDSAEKAGEAISYTGDKIKETAVDTKESIIAGKDTVTEKVKGTASNVKDATKDAVDKTGTVLSDTGDKIKDNAKDMKDNVTVAIDSAADKVKETASAAKDTGKDVAEKTGGFFSGLGKKIKSTAKDTKEEVITKAKSGKEKVDEVAKDTKEGLKYSAEKTGVFFSDVGDKIKDKAHDTKETVVETKDKAAEKIKDTAAEAKDFTKDSAEKAGATVSDIGDKVKDTAVTTKESVIAAKDSASQKIKDTVSNVKDVSTDAVSKTREVLSDTAKDTADHVVAAKASATDKVKETASDAKDASKDVVEKTGGFFSGLGKKIKGTAKDTKDEVKIKAKSGKEIVEEVAADTKAGIESSAEKTGVFFSDAGDKIKDKAHDAKDTVVEAKAKTADKIKQTAADAKDFTKDSAEKAGATISNAGDKVKETAVDIKESVIAGTDTVSQKVKDTASAVKEGTKGAVDKTKTVLFDTGDKIKDTGKDMKDNVTVAADSAADKVKETASDAKDTGKDIAEKTGGFFSGLGKKIKGTAKDTKEEVITKTKSGKEKVEEVAVDTKVGLKTSAEKTGAFFSDVGDKIKDKAHDTKETVVVAKDETDVKIKDTAAETKDFTKDLVDKAGAAITDIGDKVSDTAVAAKESIIAAKDTSSQKVRNAKDATKDAIDKTFEALSVTAKDTADNEITAKDSATENVKETVSDAEDTTKEVVEKTGGFFSGLGKKIKGTAKDTKEDVTIKAKSGKEKIEEVAVDTKKGIKSSAEKTGVFFSDVGDKIKDKAHDTKDTVVEAKDKTADKIKQTAADAKDFTKDTADKAGIAISDTGDKIKETAVDTKESVIAGKDTVTKKIKGVTKDAVDKTGTVLSDTGDKIKDTAKDIKDNVTVAIDSAADKVKETASDAKDTGKDVAEKTGGFFSGLGKKIKGTAKDTKEEVITKAKSGKEKVEEVAVDTKEGLKTSAEKTGVFFTDVGDKIKDKAHDTKETVIEAKEKTAGKIKETTADAKDFATDTTKIAGAAISDFGSNVKETVVGTQEYVIAAKDSTSQKVKDAASNVKDVSTDAVSKTHELLSDTAKDTEDSIVAAKASATDKVKETASDAKDASKDVVEKTGGFFSGLGKKIKGTAKDTKDEVKIKAKSGKEIVEEVAADTKAGIESSAEKTGVFFSDAGDTIKDKAHDAKDTVVEAKAKTADKIKQTAADAKDFTKDSVEKAAATISNAGDKVKESVIAGTDTVSQRVKDTASAVKKGTKGAVDKTKMVVFDTGDKMKDTAKDMKDNVTVAADSAADKVKETASDAKDTGKDIAEKTGGFFSGLGKKIKGTAKDTKEEVITKTKSGKEKVEEVAVDTKEDLKTSAEKTGAFFSDVGDKVKDKADDTKETVVVAKDKTADKIKETVTGAKVFAKESADKAGTGLSDLADKVNKSAVDTKESQMVRDTASNIKEATKVALDKTDEAISNTVKDTADHVISAKDSATEKVKETASDTKDVIEKTGGFFSGLGKKIKGTAKDTKEEVITKAKSGKEKVEEVAVDTKEGLKTSAEKTEAFFSDVGDKIKDKAHDTKETVVEAKEKTADKIYETSAKVKDFTRDSAKTTGAAISDIDDKIKETASDVKDTGKEVVEKTGGFFSGLGKKIKGTAKDTKEEVIIKAKSGKEKVDEVAADTKDGFKSSAEKTGAFFSNVGDKIKDKAHDTKDTVVESKDKTAEKIKKTAADLKDFTKDSAEKAGAAISDVGDNVKETAVDTKESIITAKDIVSQKVDDTASNVKDATNDAFYKTDKALNDTAKDTTDKIIAAKDSTTETASASQEAAKDGLEKTGGFFDGLEKKIKSTATDVGDEVVVKAKSGKGKVKKVAFDTKEDVKYSAEKTGIFLSDVGDKIKNKAHDTKDTVVEAKDETADKIKQTAADAKDFTKDSAEKAGAALFEAGDKIIETAVDTKESVIAGKDTATDKIKGATKDAVDKTGTVLSDTGDKIKATAKDMKDNVTVAIDSGADKITETASDAKDTGKDVAEKTGGFFSGLGKKIKGTAKDTKEEVITKAKSGKEKVEGVVVDTKEDLKSSAVKTGAFFSDVGDKIKDKAQDTKETVVEMKDKTADKIKETAAEAKDFTKESAEKSKVAISDIGDKVRETAVDKKESVIAGKDTIGQRVTETASNVKDGTKDAVDKIGEALSISAKNTADNIVATKDSATDTVKDTASDAKDASKDVVEKTGGFFSGLGKKIKGTAKDTKEEVTKKAKSDKEKLKEVAFDTKEDLKYSAEETEIFFSKVGDKIVDKACVTKETVLEAKDNNAEKIKAATSDVKEFMKDSGEKVRSVATDIGDEIKETAADKKESIIAAKDIASQKLEETASSASAKDITKDYVDKTGKALTDTSDKIKDIAADLVKDTKHAVNNDVEKTGDFFSEAASKTKSDKENVKEFENNVKVDLKDFAHKTGAIFIEEEDKFRGKVHDTVVGVSEDSDKVKKTVVYAKESAIGAKDYATQKVKDFASNVKDGTDDLLDKTETARNDTEGKIKDSVNGTKDSVAAAKDSLFDKKRSDFVCYVTTPTMQRKGIGGSQRLSKDERPALIDVSNMPTDISSDEDEYIVTEPMEYYDKHSENGGDSRGSPMIIENIPELDEQVTIHEHDFSLSLDDNKRRPLFHIGSKDEESSESGEKSEKKDIHSSVVNDKTDAIIIKTEAQSDIDLIENKLAELGKALDDLEKVNIELEPQDEIIDEKNERKLRRVERRFERMASETMEKDIIEAKDSQMTSPEVEAKREEEFRKMVSQLSQEEVSDCQRLYSTLWDDVTFTPSEEWDSKTPDSQPDDIQDLPQGEVVEVVYMGPVTLNKDHLVNKAGLEVDVIPIKRSPCTSPLPKKKLRTKGRARSAMGFYNEKQVEERGSLPDLQSTGKDDDVKLNIQKGSIMSAILKSQPTILKEKTPNTSNSSLYFHAFDNDSQFGRRKSTDSLSKGSVVSAVKEWMARSTPFGSTDNIPSIDAISLADTTISVFDDDDNDSVDMYSDSACLVESENSRSESHIPDIHIFSSTDMSALSIYDTLKLHDIQANDNDIRICATPQMRGVLYTLDQFSLGETSGGPLTKITTEGPTHLTNLDKFAELMTETPKPKPRIDKTPDSSKIVTTQFENEQLTITDETSEVVTEDVAYSDRKKFWETVSSSKNEEERPEISVKKRMSLYEEQMYKQADQENIILKKRTSVHEIGAVPPVPKPRSTLAQFPLEEQTQGPEEIQVHEIKEAKETVVEKSEGLVSEYRAAFKNPNLVHEQTIKPEIQSIKTTKQEKSESVDSEIEYLKYEHQAYENRGYLSDDQEKEQKPSEKHEGIPQIKRRQMSISQPPVAAARKTIFERSVSLPTEDLQDVSESSVKARKQFFEQQLKKEMVIDQLMTTQLEEEELQEYKTLTSTEEIHKVISPEEKLKIETIITSVKESEKDIKEVEKKLSPISSSSSQDTRTEDDITQYTPTSVRDLTKYFQPGMMSEVPRLPKDPEFTVRDLDKQGKLEPESYDNTQDDLSKQDLSDEDSFGTEREVHIKLKQLSTESEQSISSERSIELGSADELASQVAEAMQYKSDSISKPSDSLEVHVDKSEIEDSEKVTDTDQDGTDVEVKSLGAEEYLSDLVETEIKMRDIIEEYKELDENIQETEEQIHDFVTETKETKQEVQVHIEHSKQSVKEKMDLHEILEPKDIIKKRTEIDTGVQQVKKISPLREHKEGISNTVWEVSVQSQLSNEIVESVTEIPIERQVIVEKDEELSGSVRDESDLGSEIHQDHSESYDSEKVRSSSHSEVEQLILESLYHQKINPEDARKIASELIDDIEAEIERRNLIGTSAGDESEPPAPHPEIAKNQISDYLRQLAESKGLDAKEVELVESVLARKQSELSKLGRHDTQTSSMEITDEDLKYSGAECDLSLSDSHENILEEQIVQLELENKFDKDTSDIDEEKFSEKTSDIKSQDIHVQQDREIHTDDIMHSVRTETTGKIETSTKDEKEFIKKSEQIIDDQQVSMKVTEEKTELKSDKEKINLQTEIDIKSETSTHLESISTNVSDDKKEKYSEKTTTEKKVTDTSEIEELTIEETSNKTVSLDGTRDALCKTYEEIEGGFTGTTTVEKTEVHGKVDEEVENKVEHKQETTITEDGTEIISEEIKEKVLTKTVSTSEVVDHKREEKTSVTTFVHEITDEPIITFYDEPKVQSDESKSSPYESAKSPEDLVSSSSSLRKDDSDTSHAFDKPEVIFRKTKFYKEMDTSSSSGNLKTDRRSGADFEAYSSSGESHYHSFEQDSAKSRPCSSDVEGLMAAGSSEYESALTSQDVSSRSHITSTEYHTAVSSLSSRESMKSLDSESSGHMASIEVSEASETLVPSTFELEGDIIDGAVSQLLEDEVVDAANEVIEPYDRDIPEHIIRGDYPMKDKKSSFDTISDSDIHGESMDISEEDSTQDKPVTGEVMSKMKRSQEMTFQPIPKAVIADSPQSENALEMDERYGSSLEDGSVLSMSLSSQSDVAALRTVIELSRRDSDKLDGSITISGQDSMTASNMSLDKIQPLTSTSIDTSTSTVSHGHEQLSSVTLTTSIVDENGTQSVSTQVTSQAAVSSDEVYNGPTQVDYVPEYDDVVETKKVRGHRRQESTSTFVPSMIPGFTTRTDVFKSTEQTLTESEIHVSTELTLKEEHHEETKDVDETEESYETEADQGYHRQQKESGVLDTESDQDEQGQSRPHSRITKTDSEDQKLVRELTTEDKPDSEHVELKKSGTEDILIDSIERPLTPDPYEFKGSIPTTPKSFSDESEKQEILYEKQMKMSISEKSSIEEGEAEAAFSMVAHISPAHKIKVDICPILEDEDAEKHELETRERAQKEMEKRRAQIIRDQSPGSIPDIMVTEHMTPLVDREFHYPDLELEEKEALAQRSAPQTPASISSKSSEDTDQGREYILDEANTSQVILEEPEIEEEIEQIQITEVKSDVEEKTEYKTETHEPVSATESPNSDSFEMLEKPDIIDDFVVIEEVAKEAAEHDTEGKSVQIHQTKYIRKHDEEVEEYLVKSAPTPLTRMTDLKYYPDGSSSDEMGPFDFEDSPPQAGKKSTGTKTADDAASRSYAFEYDKELEASKKWIEMQFQGDQAALISAGYGYEMEFERGPLEDIKEEEATDFESSRIGSLDSQKQSVGSLGSVKDSFSSTPEYDVLAGRKFFTRSGEHDDVSMSSLQEFEHLERVISLENRRHHQGSQDSSSNGSFSKRYQSGKSGQGDDVSMSSLKEFEGLETACIEAHIIEIKAKEEEALLAQIDEAQENLISESESCKSTSSADKKNLPESEEEDYDKRMFEIDEIIKQAQSNVEKFSDMKDVVDKTESMGRGDSLEEVAKVPDLELDEPVLKIAVHTVNWGTDDVMQTSTDSLDLKPSHQESPDSLDMKPSTGDIMTASTDSIEYQLQAKSDRGMIQSDSIEMHDPDRSCMITSDSLELTPGSLAQAGQMSDSIDEDGSRIGDAIAHDQSSSSGFSIKDDHTENIDIRDQRADYLLGSTDSLDPTSSTATHATYQYETDSVMSGSFTSGGSNTMISSTDTIDPLYGQAHGVDIAAAVRKVWFDDESFGTGAHFSTEYMDDGSKPYVTEVIEPCEGDPEYSHTVHRKVELPPEIKKITFKGPNADLQLRQYIENFGEGEDVQESQEVDKDGNVHVKRVVQKRFIVKSDSSGEEKRISGPELESYLEQVTQPQDEYDLSYRNPTEFGLTKQTRTDSDGTKTIYGQTYTTKYVEGGGEESSFKPLLSSIASDVTESSTYTEYKLTRHVDNQQEQPIGSTTATFSGAAAANILRAQGSRRKPLRFDISEDDQTEVDPREHDWRFNLPRHDEQTTPDEKPDSGNLTQTTQEQRDVPDQQHLSTEMKELLEEMEKHSKK